MIWKTAIGWWVFCVVTALSQALGAPVITSFSPTAGAPGDQIQLTGSGFSAGNFTITFWNGVVVTAGRINSDTSVTVVVPNGITTGPIGIQQGTGPTLYTADDFLAVGYGPYITGFTPSFGSFNDTVMISGIHLTNTIGVQFGGVSATQFTPNADGTQITTRVPFGATNGPITVSTIFGTSNSPSAFTVIGAGPFVTGFSPISGDTSTQVQITGVHFTGVTNVTFNGRPGVGLTANSDTLIQVQPPANVLTGPIGIYTTSGSFVTTSNFFGSPTITNFTPKSGRAGTNVVITGTNLLGASAVYFGPKATTTFTVQSNFKLTAQVPIGAATGPIRVVVPAGSGFSASNFVVAPSISGFSPGFGPVGTSVTITGFNLNASTPTVRFGGVTAATPTTITSTQLVVKVPNGATTGLISVTTSEGSDTNPTRFYLPAKITSFAPTNGIAGTRVSIQGTNFLGTTKVGFNGAAAADLTVTNNNSLSAVVPTNAITGPIYITTPAGIVASTAVFYGPPMITGFTPTHGLPGTKVTINGLNLLGGSAQFSGLAAAISSVNNTQMVATVPVGALTGPITVTGPAGSNTTIGNFTLDYPIDLSTSIQNSANPVTVGSNLVYTVSLVNNGTYAAPNATFTNTLPTDVTLVSVGVPAGWALTTNGNVLSGTIASFGNGGSATLLVTVQPKTAGNIIASVTVSSDNPDPLPANNSASIVTTVQPLVLLSVGVADEVVRISWPTALTNYVLEFRDSLSADSQWTSVTNGVTSDGAANFLLETNPASARFYRLRH